MAADRDAATAYRTIVADPPWPVAKRIGRGGRRSRTTVLPYDVMTYDAIEALPVASIAAESALLFLWATRRVYREGIAARVARAWGFEPIGEVIWGLRNPGMGAGALVNDHEPVLIGSRGGLAPEPVLRGLGVHFWRQPYAGSGGKIHSAKPDGFLDLVEELAPAPRVELFARRQRLGWDTWGNEARNDVELAS